MDLNNLIIEDKTIDIEYPGYDDLMLKLRHLTRDQLVDIRKKATTNKFSRKTHKAEEEVDSDLFQSLYVKAVMVGWTGFKYKYLQEMIPIDVSQVPADEYLDGDGLFDFSKTNAEAIMKNCNDFETYVSDVLSDIGNFTKTS